MGLIDDYARRANWAFKRWQQNAYPERVTQTDLGIAVAKRVKRESAYTQTAVAGWLSTSLPRDLEVQDALARELGLEPAWLYWNKGIAPAGWEEAEAARANHVHIPKHPLHPPKELEKSATRKRKGNG